MCCSANPPFVAGTTLGVTIRSLPAHLCLHLTVQCPYMVVHHSALDTIYFVYVYKLATCMFPLCVHTEVNAYTYYPLYNPQDVFRMSLWSTLRQWQSRDVCVHLSRINKHAGNQHILQTKLHRMQTLQRKPLSLVLSVILLRTLTLQ